MIARFREALALPGKSSAQQHAAAARIGDLRGDAQSKAVEAVGAMATGLTHDARDLLVKAACGPKAEDRQIALRALLMFVPVKTP